MKIAIYGHSGSQNHGNEAIVRGLHELFPDADLQLFTMSPDVDKIFGLDLFCDIRPYMSHPKDTIIQKLKNSSIVTIQEKLKSIVPEISRLVEDENICKCIVVCCCAYLDSFCNYGFNRK